MSRLFISVDRLDAWTAEGRAALEGDFMTLTELGRRFTMTPAVCFVKTMGSDEDPYEHRQIPATRQRAPQVEVLTFPSGHLTTSEHPDLLATEIRSIAARHGVGASRDVAQ